MVRKALSLTGKMLRVQLIDIPTEELIIEFADTLQNDDEDKPPINPIKLKNDIENLPAATPFEEGLIDYMSQTLLNESKAEICGFKLKMATEKNSALLTLLDRCLDLESSGNIIEFNATNIGSAMTLQHSIDMRPFVIESNLLLATYYDITGELHLNYSETSWFIIEEAIEILDKVGMAEQKRILKDKYDKGIYPWGTNIDITEEICEDCD